MTEEWRTIKEFPAYSVSNTGKVRSEERTVPMKDGRQKTVHRRILKPTKAGAGYMVVQLGAGNKRYVHRLVAEAFLEKPNDEYEVNHIDEDKRNNLASNLEWVAHYDNTMYGERNAKCSKAMERLRKAVVAIKCGVVVCRFDSLREADRNGFDRSAVSKCCRGIYKRYKGYEWSWEVSENAEEQSKNEA